MFVATRQFSFEVISVRENLTRILVYTWPDGAEAVFDESFSRYKEVTRARVAMNLLHVAINQREGAVASYAFTDRMTANIAHYKLLRLGAIAL